MEVDSHYESQEGTEALLKDEDRHELLKKLWLAERNHYEEVLDHAQMSLVVYIDHPAVAQLV